MQHADVINEPCLRVALRFSAITVLRSISILRADVPKNVLFPSMCETLRAENPL